MEEKNEFNRKEIEKTLLCKAKELTRKSNFYKKMYDELNIEVFKDIPLIRKMDLLQDQIANPPFGSNLMVDITQVSRIHRTSGTSNKPLLLALTKEDESMVAKTGGYAFRVAGMKPGDIVFNCMNYCMWMGGAMDHLSIEEAGAVAIPYSVGHTDNLVQLMLDMQGVCLHATPSYLSHIEKVARETHQIEPRDLKIRKGFFGGESGIQNPAFRKKIEDNWGMEVLDANYGMSEAMSIMGAECAYQQGLHFTAGEVMYPELKLEGTNDVSNENIVSGAIGELVVSNMKKEAQPLIRYATGDIIKIVSTQKCQCGEQSFRFKVIGRSDDMIVMKGINFYPEFVRNIIAKYPECTGNYKIMIPKTELVDRMKVLVEVRDGKRMEELIKLISKEIKDKYFVSCNVKVVDRIDNNNNNKQRNIEIVENIDL